MQPQAVIIIPHYDDAARLKRCLSALEPQLREGIEVVVVDNASPEPPVVHAPVRLVVEHRKGAAHARNRGIAETSAHRIFFLDCDCIPDPNWLDSGLAMASQGDLVGGSITLFDETRPPRSGAEAFETVFAFDNRRYIERVGFSVTANLLTHRAVFDEIGGFRNGASEDYDWCQRARIAGYSLVFENSLHVHHPTRRDWPALKKKWRRLTRETFELKGSTFHGRLEWALRAFFMPFSIIVHIPKVLRAPSLTRGERVSAVVTLARLRLTRMRWMVRQLFGQKI